MYTCYTVFVLASAFGRLRSQRTSQRTSQPTSLQTVTHMVQTFSVMVISQNLTLVATGALGTTAKMHWSLASTRIAAGVSVLLLLSALPTALADRMFTQRFVAVMLYMLTDSSSTFVFALAAGTSVLWWSILSMTLLKASHAAMQRRTLRHVFQLANMIVVNTAITSLTREGRDNADVQAATLLMAVFFLNVVRKIDHVFEEARNYAVWKVAQLLFLIYSRLASDDTLLLFVGVGIVLAQSVAHFHETTLTELALLVAVNQILASIQASMLTCNDSSQFTLLVLYIVLIHTTQKLFEPAPKTPGHG